MPNPSPNAKRARADAEAIVRRLNGSESASAIAAEYGCHDNTILSIWAKHTTPEQRQRVRARKIARARTGRANCVPWNKGMKGLILSPRTLFKKGTLRGRGARAWRPVGTIIVRRDSQSGRPYHWIKVADVVGAQWKNWRKYRHVVWEQHHGPIPPTCRVMHRDGDTLNDDVANLELVTLSDLWHRSMARRTKQQQRRAREKMSRAATKRAAAERARREIRPADAPPLMIVEAKPTPMRSAAEVARENVGRFLAELEAVA